MPTPPRFLGNLATLFSPPAIRRLKDRGTVPAVFRALRQSGLEGATSQFSSLGEVFDFIYGLLLAHYRCEYVYKNEIAISQLLRRHSLNAAALINEVNVSEAKADLLLLNGTSVVYEIKTELDSFDRLPAQLDAYRHAFERVFVVTHLSLVARLENVLPEGVGLLALTPRSALREICDAESNLTRLEHGPMFNLLRREEYLSVIRRHFGSTPDAPNTLIYRACRTLFEQIPIEEAHGYLVSMLKARAQAKLDSGIVVAACPRSLRVHALVGNLTVDHLRLLTGQ